MKSFGQKPLIIRIIRSRVFWALVFVVAVVGILGLSQARLSDRVLDTQGQFVADNVRRSAIVCYSIEGSFPSTQEGVKYLEDNYGLVIDHKRYIVYYESLGDNIIPQIRVFPIPQSSPLDDIADILGIPRGGR